MYARSLQTGCRIDVPKHIATQVAEVCSFMVQEFTGINHSISYAHEVIDGWIMRSVCCKDSWL